MQKKRLFSASDNIRMSSEQKEKLFEKITAEIEMSEDEGTKIICESKSGFSLRKIIFPAAAAVLTGIAVVSALPALQKNEPVPSGNDISEVTEVQTGIIKNETENTDAADRSDYKSCMYENNYLIGSYNGNNYFGKRRTINETKLNISPEGKKLFTEDGEEFTEICNISLFDGRYVVCGTTENKKYRICVYDSSFENPADTDFTETADSKVTYAVSGDTLYTVSWKYNSECRISSYSMSSGNLISNSGISSVRNLLNIGMSGADELKIVYLNTESMISVSTVNTSDLTETDRLEIFEYTPDIYDCVVRNGNIIFNSKDPDHQNVSFKFICLNSDGTISEHFFDNIPGDFPIFPADFGSGYDFIFFYDECYYGYIFENDRFEPLTSQNEPELSINYRTGGGLFNNVFFRYNNEIHRTEYTCRSETIVCSDAECSNIVYTLPDDILNEGGAFTRRYNEHVFWLKPSDTNDGFTLCDFSLSSGKTEYTDYDTDPDHNYFPLEFTVTDKYLITCPDTIYNRYHESLPREKDCLYVYSRTGEFIRTIDFPGNGKYEHHLFTTDRQEPVIILKNNTYPYSERYAYVLNSEADLFEKYDQDTQPYMYADDFQTGTNGYSFYWFDRYGVYGYRKDTNESDTLMTYPDDFQCQDHAEDQFILTAEGKDGELYLNCLYHGVMKITGLK